ncbi:MAG: SNF2 helicase associated domain-containing protein [Lachnospiraceae bacterium]|nr:SNF2 helicase associated domain-containing protein [Lachnospiraceae bacterium]
MNWGTIFGKAILDRGRAYYDAGKVKNLRYENGSYQAVVRGGLPYRVEIEVAGNTIRSMRCTCPHAEEGHRCKHMAATLIAIERQRAQAKLRERMMPVGARAEERDPLEEDGPEVPFPRREVPEGEYWYYDLSHMTSGLHFTKKQCRQARELVADKSVILEDVAVNYMGWERDATAGLRALSKAIGGVAVKGRQYPVEMVFDRNRILSAKCGVPGCHHGNYGQFWTRMYRTSQEADLCVHETALLYLLADYVKKYNPGDTTDHDAVQLLEYFRGLSGPAALLEEEDAQCLELTPRLELTKEGFCASFRIGMNNPYLVKNLTELVECVRRRGEKVFGTRRQVDFARDGFSVGSQPVYEFIEEAVLEEQHRLEKGRAEETGVSYGKEIKGSLELYGARLDTLFSLYHGQQLEFQDTSGKGIQKGEILLQEKQPQFSLTIKPDLDGSGNFQGIKVSGTTPCLWEGARHLYFMEEGCLCRVSRSEMGPVLPFYDMAEEGHLRFRVGRKHLTEFYYTALPVLRRYGTVREKEAEEIASYLPPEASFAFYLDAEDKNVTCQARAVYGDQAVSVLDVLKNASGTLKEDFRDTGREMAVADLLLRYFPKTDEDRDFFHCGNSEEAVYDLLERGVDRLLAIGEVHSTDAFRHLHIRRRTKLSVGVSVDSDILDLEISSEEVSKEELMEILQSYRRKKRFYRLKNGDFLNMEDENLHMLDQLMQDLRLSPKDFVKGKMQLPAYRALYLDQMLEHSGTLYSTRDSRF